MAISDITKMMAMYNPPSDFDKDGWKKAFDISNAFADTSEKHRANRENLATSDWRVQNMNNGYQTGIEKNNLDIAELQRQYGNALATDPSAIQATIAKNNYAVTGYDMGRDSLQGQQEYLQLKQKYAFNADGSPRTEPEMYQAMLADGVTPQSPYAVSNFWQASNQARGNKQALLDKILQSAEEVIIDPATGERKRTGRISQDMLQHGLNNYIATGLLTKGDAEQLTNQLFHFSSTHSLLPAGLSIGSGLAPQLEKLNHAQPTQVVPYAEGFSPPDQAIPYKWGYSPIAHSHTPIKATPEEEYAATVENLRNWENGGANKFWNDWREEIDQNNVARREALQRVIENSRKIPNGAYPIFLQR